MQALVSQLCASLGPATADMLDKFRVDFAHYHGTSAGGWSAAVARLAATSPRARPVWTALKTATLQYCSGDHRSAAQSLVSCVAELPHAADTTDNSAAAAAAGLTVPTTRARHCRFVPLSRGAVLSYSCRLLTSLLQEKAMFPGGGGDLATGHCMVLLQHSWADSEDTRELFYHLLGRVRGRETFTYPLFCKYVVNIEMLGEVMHLASEQGGGVVMDILPGGVAGGGARPGTRGANRGEKEEFRSAMRRQAARSHEPVQDIIVDFLTSEANLILQTLA